MISESDKQQYRQTVGRVIERMQSRISDDEPAIEKPKMEPDQIHPDFPLRMGRFWQNRPWPTEDLGTKPKVKTIFTFDEVELLDECPFVCKVSPDLKGKRKFFGVAYGLHSDKDKLGSWSSRFPDSKLLTFEGDDI